MDSSVKSLGQGLENAITQKVFTVSYIEVALTASLWSTVDYTITYILFTMGLMCGCSHYSYGYFFHIISYEDNLHI